MHDEIDRILEAGLGSYSAEAPRPGLAGRVVARCTAEERRSRFAWWPWAIAIPALAALAFLMFGPARERGRAPEVAAATAPQKVSVPAPVTVPAPTRRQIRARAGERRSTLTAPAPLSEEEKAMQRLAVAAPSVLAEAQAARDAGALELFIEPIKIEPLASGDSTED